MTFPKRLAFRFVRRTIFVAALTPLCFAGTGNSSPEVQKLNDLLARTADQTSLFLDQFSDVKCTEQVRQEKLGKDEKVELKEDSTYDYLVILTNTGGELNLAESRLPIHEAKRDRKNTSMLLSNGFATLFLVFHPYYSSAFTFNLAGEEVVGANAGEGQIPACRRNEISSGACSSRTRISPRTHRDRMDRAADRLHRQD